MAWWAYCIMNTEQNFYVLKRDSSTDIFPWISCSFPKHLVYRAPLDDWSCWFLHSNQEGLSFDHIFFVFVFIFFSFAVDNHNYGSLFKKSIKWRFFLLFTIIYPKIYIKRQFHSAKASASCMNPQFGWKSCRNYLFIVQAWYDNHWWKTCLSSMHMFEVFHQCLSQLSSVHYEQSTLASFLTKLWIHTTGHIDFRNCLFWCICK